LADDRSVPTLADQALVVLADEPLDLAVTEVITKGAAGQTDLMAATWG
jgi:hypothetical protein